MKNDASGTNTEKTPVSTQCVLLYFFIHNCLHMIYICFSLLSLWVESIKWMN